MIEAGGDSAVKQGACFFVQIASFFSHLSVEVEFRCEDYGWGDFGGKLQTHLVGPDLGVESRLGVIAEIVSVQKQASHLLDALSEVKLTLIEELIGVVENVNVTNLRNLLELESEAMAFIVFGKLQAHSSDNPAAAALAEVGESVRIDTPVACSDSVRDRNSGVVRIVNSRVAVLEVILWGQSVLNVEDSALRVNGISIDPGLVA